MLRPYVSYGPPRLPRPPAPSRTTASGVGSAGPG